MKNIKFITALFIFITLISACNNEVIEQNEIAEAEENHKEVIIPTPTPEPKLEFGVFDSDYKNVDFQDSELLAVGEKIYFTTGTKMYYYDQINGEKVEVTDELKQLTIYAVNNYVYFLENERLCRINVGTDEIEVIYEDGKTGRYIAKEFYHRALTEPPYIHEFIIVDNHLLVTYIFYLEHIGYHAQHFKTIIDDWQITLIDNGYIYSNITERQEAEYPSPHSASEYAEVIIDRYLDKSDYIVGINYVILDRGSSKYRRNSSTWYGKAVLSKDQLFCKDDHQTSKYLYGININTGEEFYRKEFGYPVIHFDSINQYVFVYYFDRLMIESNLPKEGVMIFDTKQEEIFTNNEINEIISGDIDYTNLMHAKYYLDGNVLYVLESNKIEIDVSSNSEKEIEILEKERSGYLARDVYAVRDPKYTELGSINYVVGACEVNIYKAEVIDGKLHFECIYKEFDKGNDMK